MDMDDEDDGENPSSKRSLKQLNSGHRSMGNRFDTKVDNTLFNVNVSSKFYNYADQRKPRKTSSLR